MGEKHSVAIGDSVPSLAHDSGHFWETLWNHPENAELKALRKSPYILAPGDEVFIPDLRLKSFSGGTDQRHKFVRKGVPAKIRIQLFQLGEPRRNEPYTLVIDGDVIHGTTDGDGVLEHAVKPNSKGGVLKLNGGKEEYPVRVGALNPIETMSGVKQRLNNLGYHAGGDDDSMDEQTRQALTEFQNDNKLKPTGELDDATKSKLEQAHGN